MWKIKQDCKEEIKSRIVKKNTSYKSASVIIERKVKQEAKMSFRNIIKGLTNLYVELSAI